MDKNRRKFLKIILVAVGAFFAGKILDPFIPRSSGGSSAKRVVYKEKPSVFRVAENKQFLSIYDGSGEEVLQIDKTE